MNRNVCVIGLGLIGGSLAMAIKHEHPDVNIVGFDRDDNNAHLAKILGIIDEITPSIEWGVQEADLIILAVPVNETERIIAELANMNLKKDCIVTDAGSTKGSVARAAAGLLDKGITFIGGHPMAGSHKSGAGAAKRQLFENAFYLLTPAEGILDSDINRLKEWLKGTNANFLLVTPDNHDLLTGVISHFPHIIASGLVKQAEHYSTRNPLVSRLAAGGFRDITRIASSSPEMWRDILIHNKSVLVELMDNWIDEMLQVKDLITSEDRVGIYRFFQEAKEFRDDLPVHGRGAIPAYYDLYIDVPDYPGVISEITGYFAKEEISITNIRIVETREDIFGVLVVSFQTDIDRAKAAACIKKYTSFDTILV
ncbi:prephenate dehydrogenase [Peribacillus loiseleuriae]|uniref:prephenate dehydrogenase n=1 Tax=Peribacillus loiseleuriae TaxID=1679170 RepID=UPI00381D725B